mgnify:CR=1 FL=1
MTEYLSALMVCLQPINLLLIIAMVSLGIVFGAIPGLSATLGIALLLPVTFGLSTETSFVLLLAIWIGGVSGTFISAVLIGIPGSSSAIATCFDGFPMTKNGQAGKALGIGMTASFIGTVGSVALATVLSPVIAEFALHLGPWEYFSLCFCAITLVASLSKGNIFKGIMAAGIGSRFGTGIKQLEPVDDAGHIIMDYSIHDAIEAGFNHVVFIIRKDIEKEFKEVIGERIASICASHDVTVDYAFQDINDIPGVLPEGRTKPWGTGQAVLAAKKVIKTPFIVINADDYYGKEGFKAVHEYLVNGGKSCMAGFVLKNTLSDNGGVTRGICKMDEQNNLTEVVETKNIVKTAEGAEADGVAVDVNSLVSMNMWGLTPDFLDVLEEGFKEFFEKEVPGNPQKAEYLIPIFIGELLEQDKMSVKVLKTNDTWYGMTYHEDVAAVKGSFKEMLENGVYKADLFSDL